MDTALQVIPQLIPRDTLAQALVGIAIGSVVTFVIVSALGLLDLPVTWRGP